jgi:hypothetical protein
LTINNLLKHTKKMKNFIPTLLTFLLAIVAGFGFMSNGENSVMFTDGGGAALATIPLVNARALLTTKTIAVMQERVAPTGFLRSFFPTQTSLTKTVSIEVQRGTEKVAVDVIRGTNGNRNEFGLSTQKEYLPPMYWEYFTLSDLAIYDVAIAANDPSAFANMAQKAAEYMMLQRDKIERAIELQAAQVLQTGIVTLKNGDNINYKRKADSIKDINVGGDYWNTANGDPIKDLQEACEFLRKTGKSQGQTFDFIMGEGAITAFLNNDTVKERADIRNFNLDALRVGLRTSVGATPIGFVNAGSYICRLWSYPEYYDNAQGVSTPYIADGNVIALPDSGVLFTTAFAAVPQLLTESGIAPQRGEYLVHDFIDERAANHEMHIKSAPLCIPVSVDKIYTMKVI